MSQRSWVVMLALAGALFFVTYIYLANRYCPVEKGSQSLNWRLIPDLNKNEEHTRAAYRYGRSKNKRDVLPSYAIIQKIEAEQDAEQGKHESNIWLTKFACDAKLSDLLLAIFSYGLFLATVWLVWATLKLWRAADDTAKAQERDTQILQRAYISVEPGGVSKSDSNKECHPNIVVKNAGNLPAGRVRWVIYRETDKDRIRTNLPINEDNVDGLITLTPGATMTQGGDTIEVGDEPHNIRRERGLYLFVWGVVLYDDGFGVPRRTRFCHRYNLINLRDDGQPVTIPGGKYAGFWISGRSIDPEYGRYHRYGNDAD